MLAIALINIVVAIQSMNFENCVAELRISLTVSLFEHISSMCRPVFDLTSTMPYSQTGTCLLFLNLLSGVPFLFTFSHVWRTTFASFGTESVSTNCVVPNPMSMSE